MFFFNTYLLIFIWLYGNLVGACRILVVAHGLCGPAACRILLLQGSNPHPLHWGFPGGSDGKESACNLGDPGSIPGSGRSPGDGNGNPLQYSHLENPMDGGGWCAMAFTVRGVAKSQTQLSDWNFHFLNHWTTRGLSQVCLNVYGVFIRL